MGYQKVEVMRFRMRQLAQIWLLFAMLEMPQRGLGADNTFVYAVQISAAVLDSPPQVQLNWKPDPYGAHSYTVYRKPKNATSWGSPLVTLAGNATQYTDYDVGVGGVYEYQIIKDAVLGYLGSGYVLAGIQAPALEDRGRLLLIVATNQTTVLAAELSTLEVDLVGDGWTVLRHDVSESDTPAYVRNLIQAEYALNPGSTKSVFLVGHVPVLHSGNMNYDGHLTRPMPADAFYGDMDGSWPTAPSISPSYIPSNLELMVGRVDFNNMPGIGAPAPWPTETELLRNYLRKDHAWRHNQLNVPRRALMGNRRGDEAGLAVAASGYRSFEPMVGPGNIVEANTEDSAPPDQRWVSMLGSGAYLAAYGCGGGQPSGISELGTHGTYYDAWSTDVVALDAKAVFVMLFGSWFGDWDEQDNFIRSFLATPTMGLAACMSGEPHWFLHRMGLGETIGESMLQSINNSGLYTSKVMKFTRAVYIALMGDPTLRLDPVSPPVNLQASQHSNGVQLSWGAAADPVLGYHAYRSGSPLGPFTRITGSPVTSLSYLDQAAPGGGQFYMVRSLSLANHFSGSYYNLSQGAIASVEMPVLLSADRLQNGVRLTWNTHPGGTYRVQKRDGFAAAGWADASETVISTGASLSWTDSYVTTQPSRLYRIRAQ